MTRARGRRRTLLVVAALAAACGGPTRYQRANPLWGPYGYTDLGVGADEHAVTVRANARTADARVADMLLLRAAEVTLERKRTHFVILHRDTGDRWDTRVAMVPVVLPGVIVPVPVGEAVEREKTGHVVVRFCDPSRPPPPDAVDAAGAARELRTKLGL
jgi:hypothetical protein